MSISIMTEVWKIEDVSSSQKLVFLSMADNANDQGECYPSMKQIAARTCLSERAVRDAVRALEDLGYVKSMPRTGTSTVYYLSTTPAAGAAPAGNAGRQEMPPTPAAGAAPPRQQVPPTPAAGAPKPSINHQLNRHGTVTGGRTKPAKKPKASKAEALSAMELPDWLPRQSWVDWVEHREAVKAPLTARAAALGIRHLERLMDAGNDPVEVIEQSVRTGRWTDFYPLKNTGQGGAAGSPANRQEALEAKNHQVGAAWAARMQGGSA